MFYFTSQSFGNIIAIILGVIAMVVFWALMRREETRLIGQNIAIAIRNAIKATADVENFIEIKRVKSGIIARVYLINAKDSVAAVQKAVKRAIDASKMKKYLWVMQLTDIASRDELAQTQKILNDQLYDQLVNHYEQEDDKEKDDK